MSRATAAAGSLISDPVTVYFYVDLTAREVIVTRVVIR